MKIDVIEGVIYLSLIKIDFNFTTICANQIYIDINSILVEKLSVVHQM